MTYSLFLNGRFYGSGNLRYMNELITDYLRHGMYGRQTVEFKVVKRVYKTEEVTAIERSDNVPKQGDRK